MIVAITVSGRGRQVAKYIRLERHLRKYLEALQGTVPQTKVAKLRIVTSDANDLVRRIEGVL